MSTGMEPVNLLDDKVTYESEVRDWIDEGMEPDKFMLLRSSDERLARFPIAEGILPDIKGLNPKLSWVSEVKFVMASGIVPCRELLTRSSTRSREKRPIETGISPEIRLIDKSSSSSAGDMFNKKI